ncbi:bifunctional aminoglycoside phosphotransferase/ATP-binding protein [soil metagenome]
MVAAPHTAEGGVSEAPEVHETHTGMVVLIGDRAYKGKKPVVTDFLDFRSVQSREEACEREVRLNSRLAAGSYLGVAHLTDPAGGEPEPVVVMRRYPDAFRLASMVRRGEAVKEHLSAIATMIARFHAEAARSREIDMCARIPATRERWQENLDVLRQHVGNVLDAAAVSEAQRLALQFIEARAVLFEHRITERRIVDGHGDLIADDIFCPPDGLALLDCLEFDDRLRYVDGLDDACFLAMDLEFLGRRDLGDFFLDEYRQRADDPAPPALVDFFIAYRAVVRAKVDCIRAVQGQADAADDARRHLDLARDHLRAGTVRLILVGGSPGSGKTTLARALGEQFSAQVISSDDVRREMQGAGDIEGESGAYKAGLYSSDQTDAVYATMLSRARPLLAGGRSVVLDGTWRDPRHRAQAKDLSRQESCPTVELACTVPLDIAVARIAHRPPTTSDVTPQIAAVMADEHPDWADAYHIDTNRPVGESLAEALELCCLAL